MEKKDTKFIISVVPLVKIPLSRDQYFFYLFEEKLPVGTLVRIPLFRKDVDGVVIRSTTDFPRLGNIKLKNIKTIVERSFLNKKQIGLALFLSEHYFSSLGITLKGFIPKISKRKSTEKVVSRISVDRKKIALTEQQMLAVGKISGKKAEAESGRSKFVLFGPAGSGKTEVYIHSIMEIRKRNQEGQFLVLVPEKTLTPQALERYGAHCSENEIVLLSSNLSKSAFFMNWERIRSGEAKIIIGTRMAVFAPFQKLALIVIDEEQDNSYKQWDMNPRYDARTAALHLAEAYAAPIVFGSATPRLETYHKALDKEYELLTLPTLAVSGLSQKRTEINIVDMRKERWEKNYSCLSKKLRSEISFALKNHQQTILFINRQGMSNFSICDSCRTTLRCPKCDRTLIYDHPLGQYRCIHCSYGESFPHCSNCDGLTFKNIGLGTQKVEKEVISFFPSARVLRIDSGQLGKKDFQDYVYQEFTNKKIDVLIGTQMITKGWDLPALSLVGIIDADNMLSLPDFRTNEKAFYDLMQLFGRVARPGAIFPGLAIIQTYHPENHLFKLAAEKNYATYVAEELKNRKALSYPPFGRIAKLLFQDYNKAKVVKETDMVYTALDKVGLGVSISAPSESFVDKIRGRHRKQIIIKFKESLSPELSAVLRTLPQGWVIDIDPISII